MSADEITPVADTVIVREDPVAPAERRTRRRDGRTRADRPPHAAGLAPEPSSEALAGRGALVLLAGEAGSARRASPRTRCAAPTRVLRGAALPPGAPPYGPVVAALRSHLRREPGRARRLRAAARAPRAAAARARPAGRRRATARRCSRRSAARSPTVAPRASSLLDDLQWSDDATLELLAALAAPLRDLPVLVVAAYRSDEVPRRIRCGGCAPTCAAAGCCASSTLEPLDAAGDRRARRARARRGARRRRSPARSTTARRACRSSSRSSPRALLAGSALRAGPARAGARRRRGRPGAGDDPRRGAAALRRLSPDGPRGRGGGGGGRRRFDLDLRRRARATSCSRPGLVVEREPGRGRVPPRARARGALRRRALAAPARRCTRSSPSARGARARRAARSPRTGSAARERERALDALVAARELAASTPTATRRGVAPGARALAGGRARRRSGWPCSSARPLRRAGGRPGRRGARAARGARRAAAAATGRRAGRDAAPARRGLRAAGRPRRARSRARRVAAEAFAAAGLAGEAAAERLLRRRLPAGGGRHGAAVELARAAGDGGDARPGASTCARGRSASRAWRAPSAASSSAGVETVRAGLSLALEHELTAEAAEVYQRLGTALETAADYGGAREALDTAVGLCGRPARDGPGARVPGLHGLRPARARRVGRGGRARAASSAPGPRGPTTRSSPTACSASILVFRGEPARPAAAVALPADRRRGSTSSRCRSTARPPGVDRRPRRRPRRGGRALPRPARRAGSAARTTTTRSGACAPRPACSPPATSPRARACADALAAIAAAGGHPTRSRRSRTRSARSRCTTATRTRPPTSSAARSTCTPTSRSRSSARRSRPRRRRARRGRASASWRRSGWRRPTALARRLGARPLAAPRRPSSRGSASRSSAGSAAGPPPTHEGAGLSRRELEVCGWSAVGRTNREIARELFLSPRTVDMHVRNILAKLGCRSRTEAASRAAELGLLA